MTRSVSTVDEIRRIRTEQGSAPVPGRAAVPPAGRLAAPTAGRLAAPGVDRCAVLRRPAVHR